MLTRRARRAASLFRHETRRKLGRVAAVAGLEPRRAAFLSFAAHSGPAPRMPGGPAGGHPSFCNGCLVRRPLGLSDALVDEVDEAVTDGSGLEEGHGLLVAGFAEKP